ncbi:MAG: hypothetical protein ACR2J6_02465 [Thermoleophilaceae bacterium]
MAACFLGSGLAGPASDGAQAKPLLGLSDNRPETLADPRFGQSGIRRTRVLIHYDQVRRGGRFLREQDAYFAAAQAQGVSPLVSFYRTGACSPKCAARRLPSVSGLRSDFRRFRKRYPWVKRFSTWNEMNFPLAQPTGRNPKRAGQFYKMLRKECRGGKCTVLTGDFRANGSKFDERWIKTFKKTIGGGAHKWGLISHPEVNRFHARYTRKFLRTVRGPVYVTEVGAINFFRHVHRPSLSRQNRAMRFILGPYSRVSSRIKEMYVYNWRAARHNSHWDSGLISRSGVRRPAYYTFFRGLRRKAP